MTAIWIFLWFVSGAASFLYWWIRAGWEIDGAAILTMMLSSILGPFSFIVNWIGHSGSE